MFLPDAVKTAIKKVASENDLDVRFCLAVAQVESSFYAFLPNGYPIIRFEKHVFLKQIRKIDINLLDAAMSIKGTDYNAYTEARDINEEAAILSTSFGLYQIMGFNHKLVGYDTPKEFEEAMKASIENQVDAFIKFVKANKLVKAINSTDYHAFAKAYNGPAYAQWGYHVKLQKAYESLN